MGKILETVVDISTVLSCKFPDKIHVHDSTEYGTVPRELSLFSPYFYALCFDALPAEFGPLRHDKNRGKFIPSPCSLCSI